MVVKGSLYRRYCSNEMHTVRLHLLFVFFLSDGANMRSHPCSGSLPFLQNLTWVDWVLSGLFCCLVIAFPRIKSKYFVLNIPWTKLETIFLPMFYPCELMSTETPWAVDRWQGSAIHRCPPLISYIFAKTKHMKQAWHQAVRGTKLWGETLKEERHTCTLRR